VVRDLAQELKQHIDDVRASLRPGFSSHSSSSSSSSNGGWMPLQYLDIVSRSRRRVQYVKIFKPVDTQEWCYIFQEMNQFFQADSSVDVRLGSSAAIVSNRLPRSEAFPSRIRLQEAILVGNTHSQVKFGELSLDLFRVMQVLEREPSSGGVSDGLSMGNRMSDSQESSDKAWTKKRSNPHKCLLYRPMLSQLLVFASTAFKVRVIVA